MLQWEETHSGNYFFKKSDSDNSVWTTDSSIVDAEFVSTFTVNVPTETTYIFEIDSGIDEHTSVHCSLNGEQIPFGFTFSYKELEITLKEGTNVLEILYYKYTDEWHKNDYATVILKDVVVENFGCKNIKTNEIGLHSCNECKYVCDNCGYKANDIIGNDCKKDENKDTKCDICGEIINGYFDNDNNLIIGFKESNTTSNLSNAKDIISAHSEIKKIIIPAEITEIGDFVFYASGIEEITISNNIKTIGIYAVRFCQNLTKINFNGTINEWNNISLSSNWNSMCQEITVHCTDGDIVIPANSNL